MSTTCGYSGCRVDRVLRVDPASSIQRVQMTAFGATSLFTVAPAKVGNPPFSDSRSSSEQRPGWAAKTASSTGLRGKPDYHVESGLVRRPERQYRCRQHHFIPHKVDDRRARSN